MAHQSTARLDESGLNSRQRPALYRFWQSKPSHEGAQVVGEDEQPQPHLVGYELVAREPSLIERVFAFFNPLFRNAAAIVEADYSFHWIAKVCDDEAHSGKQFALVPLHLGNHAPRNTPTLGLVREETVTV